MSKKWSKTMVQLLKHDFIEGIWRRKHYFLLAVIVTLFSCIGMHQSIRNLSIAMETGKASVIDYWIYLTMCGEEYKLDLFSFFEIPVRWVCLHAFLLICIGDYVLVDVQQWGYQVLMRAKGRLCWWSSKVIWAVGIVLCYYLSCFATISIYALWHGVTWSIEPSRVIVGALCGEGFVQCSVLRLLCISVVQPILLSIMLAFLQLVCNMLLEPMHSFVLLFVVLVVSTYHKSWLLVGNWGMSYRMYPVEQNGLDPGYCLLLEVAGILIGAFFGYFLYQRKDIYSVSC